MFFVKTRLGICKCASGGRIIWFYDHVEIRIDYLDPLQIDRIHDCPLKELNGCEVPLEQSLQFQIRRFTERRYFLLLLLCGAYDLCAHCVDVVVVVGGSDVLCVSELRFRYIGSKAEWLVVVVGLNSEVQFALQGRSCDYL